MASRKRSVREMSSSRPCSSLASVDDVHLDGNNEKAKRSQTSSKVGAKSEAGAVAAGTVKFSSSSSSSESVKETGLKILFEAERLLNPQSFLASSSTTTLAAASLSLPLVPEQFIPHQAWSEQTAKWCYDVLDHLQLSREIVYLAMNVILEQELSIDDSLDNTDTFGITNKHEYEKVAITSLYLAIRLSAHQTSSKKNSRVKRRLHISELLTISGSSWTMPDIQQCSTMILQSLGLWIKPSNNLSQKSWNFPLHQALVQATPHSFCKLLFFGFHKSSSMESPLPRPTRLAWLELALYLIELSVCDGGFHRLLPSIIALASLQTAAKILYSSSTSFQSSIQIMEETLQKAYKVAELPNTTFVRNRLEFIYQQSQENNQDNRRQRSRRSNRNESAVAQAFTCPSLVINDNEDDEDDSSIVSEIRNLNYNPDTDYQQQPQDHQANEFHPIRQIQSNIDLEALSRMHRPISPCPNFETIHDYYDDHHREPADNVSQNKKMRATSNRNIL